MDPRKRRALVLQETSDNASSVATPRTRVPGKASKVPPNMAPLESVLPEDMRLAHTSTTLELMQAHVSATDTKGGDTRLRRDVRRWRDEAGAVRDALLLREEAERSAKMAMVNRMGSMTIGGTEDDGTSVTNSGATSDGPSPSNNFGDGFPARGGRSRSVQWVEAYRPEQGAAIATAKAREARKAALALAREAAKKKAEEKAARKAEDPRSSFQKALDLTKRALGLESAYAAMYAGELARRERAEKEKAAAANAKRRDAALDANVLLFDELTAGSGSSEREATLRARFRERVADAGEVLAHLPRRADSRLDRASGSHSTTPCLCVIERGCVEIRVALGDEFRDESFPRDPETRDARDESFPRARLGFGPSRLVATLSRGHMFAVDGAVLASLFGCPARATFAVVVRDSAAESEEKSDEKCVLWELRDRAAFAAMAPSLLRDRAAFAALWASVPALGAFSEPARAFFMDAARRVTKRPGAHFCVEREPCDAIGVVETGRAIAHRRARDDENEKDAPPPPATTTEEPRGETPAVRPARRVILGEYARGDFFGARALRDDAGAPTPALYAATTTARDVTSALVVTRAAFLRMTRGAPGGFGSGTDCLSTPTRSTKRHDATKRDMVDLHLKTPNDEQRGGPSSATPEILSRDAEENADDAFLVPGVSGAAAAEERAWRASSNRAPPEHSAVARLLLDALLRTPPFVAVGRSVVANAEAATRRARPRRVRVGDTLFRRGDLCVGAFVVQTGVLRLVGDDHGGELADEHVEIPEDDDDENGDDGGPRRPRPFGDERVRSRLAETRVSGVSAAGSAAAKNQTDARAAPGAGVGLRVVAELGPGDACGFAALPHPGCGATWQCSALAAASPSPGAWVTVWELGLKDFHQTAGYAVDDKRDRFASLLEPATCPALAGLSDRQRLRALDALDLVTYEHGEYITMRGAPSEEGVFVVMRGVANEETGGASAYAAFPASGVDATSAVSAVSQKRRSRDGRVHRLSGNAGGATSATPTTSTALRRGDVFGTDGVFDVFGTREKSVTAGGGVGARVSCAVWRPAALAQLGFLRRALEEFQRRRA